MAPVAVLAGAAVVGTTLQVAGSISKASAEAAARRKNAKIAEENAQFVEQQTEVDVERFLEQVDRTQASARANIGASGIRLTGSAAAVLASNAIRAQRDVEQIRLAGTREARNLRAGAQQQLQLASQALTSGFLTGAGQFFSGLGSIAGAGAGGASQAPLLRPARRA